jgi:hypothetical protein
MLADTVSFFAAIALSPARGAFDQLMRQRKRVIHTEARYKRGQDNVGHGRLLVE